MRHPVGTLRKTTIAIATLAMVAMMAGDVRAQLFGRNRRVVVSTPHGAGPIVVDEPRVVLRPAFDPLRDALGRLRSRHDKSRRDGALTLGRLGDPRAVPDLVWLLRNDRDRDVRQAAALALGSIGDARAMTALRLAAATDRNRRVRQAANHAYGRIVFEAPVVESTSAAIVEVVPAPPVEIAPEPVELRSLPPSEPVGGEVLRSTPLPSEDLPSPLPPPASELPRSVSPRVDDVEPPLDPQHAEELPPGPLSEPLPPLDPPSEAQQAPEPR